MAYTGEQRRQYQLEWLAKRRNAWIEAQGGKCAKCGSTDRLEVDHIERTTKELNPSNLWSRNEEFRNAELAKCQVLCYDCHKIKTTAESLVDLVHGTTTAYDKGCKCQLCRDVKAEGMRRLREKWKHSGSGNSGVAPVS